MAVAGVAPYRVRANNRLFYLAAACLNSTNNTAKTVRSVARILHDDGTNDEIKFRDTDFAGVASGATWADAIPGDHPVKKDGWIVSWTSYGDGTGGVHDSTYLYYGVASDDLAGTQFSCVARGHSGYGIGPVLGTFEEMRGPLWAYVATITNGAGGAGSHFYDVTPTAGGEIELLGGHIVNGDTVAVTFNVRITDGTDADGVAPAETDILFELVPRAASLAAGTMRCFPTANVSADGGPAGAFGSPIRIRGTMKLKVNTGSVALSQDTQLSLLGRLKSSNYPAVTLNGASTPTLTVVTNQVF